MNKTQYLSLLFILLSACRSLGTSSVSSLSHSSIPIPTEDFNPVINGRTILRETTIQANYAEIQLSDLDPIPLAAYNYATTQGVQTPYAELDAVEGNFENQSIQFASDTPDIRSNLSSLTLNQAIEDQAAMAEIHHLQASDERFNQTEIIRKHRDLSHVYFGSSYYWFNNYVEEEQLVISRHPNFISYGQGNTHKTYQTEISIDFTVEYQLFADASTIYEIFDQTYPSGFFGSQDRKFETIRTQHNFKQALTMGPLTLFRQQWMALENNQPLFGMPFHGDITLSNRRLSIEKLGETTFEFKLQVYLGNSFETAEENYQIRATLQGSNWEDTEQHYQLWQPSAITP